MTEQGNNAINGADQAGQIAPEQQNNQENPQSVAENPVNPAEPQPDQSEPAVIPATPTLPAVTSATATATADQQPSASSASSLNPERQARINQRRLRIKQKLAELQHKPIESEEQVQVAVEKPPTAAEVQISQSLTSIDAKQQQLGEKVALLQEKQAAEAAQLQINDETAKQQRFHLITEEREKADQAQKAFELRFAAIVDKNVENQAAGLVELRQTAMDSLHQRDDAISALQSYLDCVDDDFLRIIRENAAQITDLVEYQRKCCREFQLHSEDEIDKIAAAFDTERAELLKSQESELDSLRNDLSDIENKGMETRFDMQNANYNQQQLNIIQQYQEYSELKRKLEAEGVALRTQLEEMRSLYHLNTDKLEYNYKLLASRDVESQNLIVENRKLIAKLQNQLAKVVARYNKCDGELRDENLSLSQQYRRISNVYIELQQKFKLFERQDTEKFKQLWKYHENLIAMKLKELLLAEQIINESVVCTAPKRDVDEKQMLQTIQTMLRRLQASAGVVEDVGRVEIDQSQQNLVDITRSINPVSACTVGQANATRLLLDLSKKLSFMASDDLLKVLHPEGEFTDQNRTDALLSTLGIRNASELDLLFQHITQGGSCQKLKDRGEIVQALIEFASELEKRRDLGGNQMNKQDMKKGGIWSQKAVSQFWKEIGQIVSPEKATAWKLLEDTMKKYQQILLCRVDLVERNDLLAAQNEELRGLLQQYVDGEQIQQGVQQPQQGMQQSGTQQVQSAEQQMENPIMESQNQAQQQQQKVQQ